MPCCGGEGFFATGGGGERRFALASIAGLPGAESAAGTAGVADTTDAGVASAADVAAAGAGLSAGAVAELSDGRESIQRFAPNPAATNTTITATALRAMYSPRRLPTLACATAGETAGAAAAIGTCAGGY